MDHNTRKLTPFAKGLKCKPEPKQVRAGREGPHAQAVPLGLREAHKFTCLQVYVYMFICLYVYSTCVYIYIYIYRFIYIHVYIYMFIYIHT